MPVLVFTNFLDSKEEIYLNLIQRSKDLKLTANLATFSSQ